MYSPRHARPSCLPARAAVTGGLTAVLLPIALAAPALAQETVSPSTSDTSSATPVQPAPAVPVEDSRSAATMQMSASPTGVHGYSRIGVRLLDGDRPVEGEEVAVEAATSSGWTVVGRLVTNADGWAVDYLPFSQDTRVRSVFAGNASLAPQTSAEALVRHRTPTELHFSAGETASDGRARIGVRVMHQGVPVRGTYVAVEALSREGWKSIGRLLTDDQGLAVGRLPFSRDTRVRSTFSGTNTALPRTSPEAVVRYVATLGQQAVRIAAQQAGKPYRYGAIGPNSFDCSGYIYYIYKTRLGRNVPRTSAQQAAYFPRVAQSAKRQGDLLFFRSGGRVTHVGVYAGGNKMWVSPKTGDVVKLQSIYTTSYTVGRVG